MVFVLIPDYMAFSVFWYSRAVYSQFHMKIERRCLKAPVMFQSHHIQLRNWNALILGSTLNLHALQMTTYVDCHTKKYLIFSGHEGQLACSRETPHLTWSLTDSICIYILYIYIVRTSTSLRGWCHAFFCECVFLYQRHTCTWRGTLVTGRVEFFRGEEGEYFR